MYLCEISKVIYSQIHGSPMLKAFSFKSLNWIFATIFAELIQSGQLGNFFLYN